MLISVSRRFRVSGDSDLDEVTDRVMDALLEFEAIDPALHDSDVTAELTNRIVTLGVVVDAVSLDEGERLGHRAMEAAIATSNGHLKNPIAHKDTFVSQAQSAELVDA